jgi:hypothetical protein
VGIATLTALKYLKALVFTKLALSNIVRMLADTFQSSAISHEISFLKVLLRKKGEKSCSGYTRG